MIITILVVLTAAFAFINIRFLKLPQTIGMMIISLIFSLLLIVSGLLIPEVSSFARGFIGNIDFSKVLLDIMLSFLLFAGALHTDSSLLKANRRSILYLPLSAFCYQHYWLVL